MANYNRLIEMGMAPELAKVLLEVIDGAVADAVSGITMTAADVSFDPDGVPGITAETVQGAIDELANIVDGL